MRKFLLSAICVMAYCSFLTAQLRVDSVGNVHIDKMLGVGVEPVQSSFINVQRSLYGLGGNFGIQCESYVNGHANMSNKKIVSILGTLITDTTNSRTQTTIDTTMQINAEIDSKSGPNSRFFFQSAIAGLSNTHIAIYGANRSSLPSRLSGIYAGYFDGDVKVNGTLTATTITTTSDYRLKQNISYLKEINNLLSQLNPISFNFKQDTTNLSYTKNVQEKQNTHYGFVAQEVQKVLPNIVYENQDGYLSVNYIELIPLLIQSAKEFQTENKELKDRIESLELQIKEQSQNPFKVQGKPTNSEYFEPILYQNQPNPFSQNTEIKYSLPLTTQSATLYIYDMSGVQLRSYPIIQMGESSIIINANDLTAGMYLYSLIADGQVIDTKRMILTK